QNKSRGRSSLPGLRNKITASRSIKRTNNVSREVMRSKALPEWNDSGFVSVVKKAAGDFVIISFQSGCSFSSVKMLPDLLKRARLIKLFCLADIIQGTSQDG